MLRTREPRTKSQESSAGNIKHKTRTSLIAVALLLLALLPRTVGLADFFTTDEAYHWIERVETFSDALTKHNWDQTNQTGHPGVTLMWLGSAGLALERLALAHNWIASPTPIAYLAWLRTPSALLEALLVPCAYLLLGRLVAPTTALIATFLWATSPYLIAHSRLLHLDALLTSFVTFSVLLLLCATTDERRPTTDRQQSWFVVQRWSFVGSGIFAGLALLTKGPALILLPIAGLLMLWLVPAPSFGERLRRTTLLYVAWLGVAVLVVGLLWPALWANSGRVLHSYIEEITANGGRPNGDGQFFFGRAVADPGAFFYPVADVFRMTPLMCGGLLAGLGCTMYGWRTQTMTSDGRDTQDRRVLLALGFFVVFWTLVMTFGPKKFDRYVLPTWPALLILAAAGWTRVLRASQPWFAARPQWFLTLGFWCLALVEASQPLLAHPYYISYYNPLLGGGAVAQRVLLIGWGEGMERVGALLRMRPDIAHASVLSALTATLRPFVPVPVRDVDQIDKAHANYAVVYRESLQRAANPDVYRRIQETQPIARVTIHGIDYALIYQLPKPYTRAVGAHFGDDVWLRGVTVAKSAGQLVVTPAWDVRVQPATDYAVFVHVLDAHGQRVAQIDVAPGGDRPTHTWQTGEQIAVPLSLTLPNKLPPGRYELVLGVYIPANGTRVPFSGAPAADTQYAGPNAVLLDTLTLP